MSAFQSKHANVSIFVPHLGCKHLCSFCNQNRITAQSGMPSDNYIISTIETALTSLGDLAGEAEIAFFGGSFTAINQSDMLRLLNIAYPYVKDGIFKGVRLSTRPDAIDKGILALLKLKGVTAIELGAQSMDDRVLNANFRGHTAAEVKNASRMIRSAGISLGLQMMTGLPMDSDEKALRTARELIALMPDTVRIYPAIVLKGTKLAQWYEAGEYIPQTLHEAVTLCAKLLLLFHEAGIPVIRLGLHELDKSHYIAGPWHPAFRELSEGEIYLSKAKAALSGLRKPLCNEYILYVPNGAVSRMAGQHRRNLIWLKEAGYHCRIREKDTLCTYCVEADAY